MSDNPFTSDADTLEAVRSMLAALHHLGMLSVRVDAEITVASIGAATIGFMPIVDEDEPTVALHVILHELADMIHFMLSHHPGTVPLPDCQNPKCEDNHVSEATFMEAALRGDFEACAGVIRAQSREGVRLERPIHIQLLKFFTDTFMLFLSECLSTPLPNG